MRKSKLSLCCLIFILDRGRLGLITATWATLDGMYGSECSCAKMGARGQLTERNEDISEGWTCCYFWVSVESQRTKESLTWMQVIFNMLQLLPLTIPGFCTVQVILFLPFVVGLGFFFHL